MPHRTPPTNNALLLNNSLFVSAQALALFAFAACVGGLLGDWRPCVARVLRWAVVASAALTAVEFVRERVMQQAYAGLGALVLAFTVVLPMLFIYAAVALVGYVPGWARYVFLGVLVLCAVYLWLAWRVRSKAETGVESS